MKFLLKIIYLLVALLAGAAIVACTDDGAEAVPTLEISHTNGESLSGATINFEQEGGTLEIAIKSNTAWSIGSTVPWIALSAEDGSGNGSVTMDIELTTQPRSAVIVIQTLSSSALRHTFNVVQTVSQQPDTPNEPSDNPSGGDDSSDGDDSIPMLPEDTPDNGNDGNNGNDNGNGGNDGDDGDDDFDGTMTPEDPDDGDDSDSDNDGDNSGDDAENPDGWNDGDDNGNNDNVGSTDPENPENPDNPDNPDNSDDNTDTPDNTPDEAFTLVDNTTLLAAGRYYIGGYRDDGLHLAVAGLTEGHCNTTPYIYTGGSLTPSGSTAAIEVRLEAADEANGYYIYFVGQGYLSATKAAAGQLRFTEERSAYWIFSNHPEGGFVVKQSGGIDVKLIISAYARINALLRSIAGDEDGNAVMLWRINR